MLVEVTTTTDVFISFLSVIYIVSKDFNKMQMEI